jgi:hypothetical protein
MKILKYYVICFLLICSFNICSQIKIDKRFEGTWKGYVVEIDSVNGNSYYGLSLKINYGSVNLFYSHENQKCSSKLQVINTSKGLIEAKEKNYLWIVC